MASQQIQQTIEKINLNGLKQSALIQQLRANSFVKEIDFGKLNNENLKAISEIFADKQQQHNIQFITISEDQNDIWNDNTKQLFLSALRINQQNLKIMSVDVISNNIENNLGFITELSLICNSNRQKYCKQFQNNQRSKILDQKEIDYFEENNYQSNAIKFSCKKYINNVFKNILDDGLYLIQKERTNEMRDDQILNITKGEKIQKFKEDIFTAKGSCVFLAKYLWDNLEASYQREQENEK